MGQKITEHPSVDNWVKLMRERDAALHKFPDAEPLRRRPAKDAKEWDQYGEMQRARTKTMMANNATPRRDATTSFYGDSVRHFTDCLACGMVIDDVFSAFVKRQVFTDEGRIDYHLCAACAGK